MPEQIFNDIYLIKIPLPGNPLKNLNSYFIKGIERNLLIDTGFNNQICLDALTAGLNEIGADMNNTDIFLTHFHSDHTGLCAEIASENSMIYLSEIDANYINTFFQSGFFKYLEKKFMLLGFTKEEFEENIRVNPSIKFASPRDTIYQKITDGYVIDLGTHKLKAILTPGHTPGHMCLYDENNMILFSGDHIIFDITPNITTWEGFTDSLGSYMTNLEKIKSLKVNITLPGHRNVIGNCNQRIDTLLDHHYMRIKDALEIVNSANGLTSYQVASKMHWSIRAKNWDDFPISQKWFATGEATSHLEYLLNKNLIQRFFDGAKNIYYSNNCIL